MLVSIHFGFNSFIIRCSKRVKSRTFMTFLVRTFDQHLCKFNSGGACALCLNETNIYKKCVATCTPVRVNMLCGSVYVGYGHITCLQMLHVTPPSEWHTLQNILSTAFIQYVSHTFNYCQSFYIKFQLLSIRITI